MQPKKTKFKKKFKGKLRRLSKGGNTTNFGLYALKSLNSSRISAKQIEAARKAIVKYIKKTGKMWIRIFPDLPVTKKPIEIRMGKGKGEIDQWVCKVAPGKILFEITGISEDIAKKALRIGGSKLNVNTSFIKINDEYLC